MSNVQKVTASAIAKLINVPEPSIDGLVKSGALPKPVSGKFELITTVRSYCSHLRTAHLQSMDQASVARYLDMSERNLRDVLRGLGLEWPVESYDQIRTAYIRDLRMKAAGRGGDDQALLTRAKTRDAEASAKLREVQFFESIGKLVSVDDIEPQLEAWATVGQAEHRNAINKIIADIEGEHGITVNRDMVDGYSISALKAIGDHPGRVASGSPENTGESAH